MPSTVSDSRVPLRAVSGRSRDGQPLSYNRAAAPDLTPWIARLFVTIVDQPATHTIEDRLLNDTSFVRVLVRGAWTAEAANGLIAREQGALLFGPHSRSMPISVTGPFATFGFALQPGAHAALGNAWGELALDTVTDLPTRIDWTKTLAGFDHRTPEEWLAWVEERMRLLVSHARPPAPDPLAAAFDRAAFADPTEPIAAFAARHGVSERSVARMARKCFALTPKQVMRRARVLDMASQLLGMADRTEADAHALRFYDQSHLIREFRTLMGMTPGDLARTPCPILALSLESRQARRLEALGRLQAGDAAPWR